MGPAEDVPASGEALSQIAQAISELVQNGGLAALENALSSNPAALAAAEQAAAQAGMDANPGSFAPPLTGNAAAGNNGGPGY